MPVLHKDETGLADLPRGEPPKPGEEPARRGRIGLKLAGQLRDVFPDLNCPVGVHLYFDCFRSVKIVGVVAVVG
jgi:hypothetical protein